jgi:hypothetical protein
MLTEQQQRLCMKFANGRLSPAEPPDWFVKHLDSAEAENDWQGSILKQGASRVDSFGDTETFEIYRAPKDRGYFIDYHDVFESAGWIFIDSVADYLTFRATMLFPLAMLSMEGDRFEAWNRARKEAAGVR